MRHTWSMRRRRSARRSSRGQGLVEYALLIALVAAMVVVGLVTIAPKISGVFQELSPYLAPNATTTTLPDSAAPTATPDKSNNGCGNDGNGNGGVGNCH